MATKTEAQIEKDIYRIVKASEIATLIGGTVYRRGMRPKNAETEDCVVKFVSGEEGQFQIGVVNVNIYVPMITSSLGNNKVENLSRVDELEEAIIALLESGGLYSSNEYKFELQSSPQAIEVEDIEQTCICTQLRYERTTIEI